MAHVEGIELEERTLKLMERFEHLYGGTVTGELEEGARVDHRMFTLWWDDTQWVEFGVTVPGHNEDGDWYLYTLPVYGDAHYWPRKVLLEQSFSTIRLRFECSEEEYRETLDQEVYYFLSWYMENLTERPRQKYLLEEERNGEYRIILAPDRHPEAGSKAGGLVDGPGVLPHWGTAWITNTCLVKSVRLWENTLVRANSTIVGFPDGGKMPTIDAEYISQSHLYLLKDSFINGRHLDNVKLSGGVVMSRGSVLTDSTIGPSMPKGYVRIPEGTSLKSANLTANVNGKLPFVTVGPIGSESGQLTVWKDDVLTGIRVRRGCFTGTVEEFLEANEKTHKDVNLEVYEIYRDLLPILQKQVLKVANDTPEYDEDEE